MKSSNLIRTILATATVVTLVSTTVRSTAAELRPLVVIGVPLDSVAIQHPVPTYPRRSRVLAIEGDIRLLVQVERGEIVKVTMRSGAPLLADFSSHWVRRLWKFKPSVSGQYFLPISYKLRS